MRPHYSLTIAPYVEPVTLAQVTAHVRVDSTDDQEYISDLIAVGREYVDSVTGRVSVQCTWKVTAASWAVLLEDSTDTAKIYRTPLVSVSSVQYYATDAVALTTMSGSTAAGSTRKDTNGAPGCGRITPRITTQYEAVQSTKHISWE